MENYRSLPLVYYGGTTGMWILAGVSFLNNWGANVIWSCVGIGVVLLVMGVMTHVAIKKADEVS